VKRESSIDGRLQCSLFHLLAGRNSFSQSPKLRTQREEVEIGINTLYTLPRPERTCRWHVPTGAFKKVPEADFFPLHFAFCSLPIAYCPLPIDFCASVSPKGHGVFLELIADRFTRCQLPVAYRTSSVHRFICSIVLLFYCSSITDMLWHVPTGSASSLLRGFLVVCSQNGGVLRGRYDQFTKELRGRPWRGLIINEVCYIILSRMFRFMSRKVKQLPV
jgi:hypothetical protein